MTTAIIQAVIPVVPITSLDDSAWTEGDPAPWVEAFLAQIAASRAAGVLVRGRVHVAADVASRIFGPQSVGDLGPWSSPLLLHTHSALDGKVEIYADLTVPTGSARIE